MLKEIGADMTSVYRSRRRKKKKEEVKKESKEEELRKGNRGGK